MARFDYALQAVFRHEGGYVRDPLDSGGATNMGITHGTLARWRKVKSVTPAQVKAMTKLEAGQIYKALYWDKLKLDEMTSQTLAEAVMDMGVNAGVKRAGLLLQEALNWVRRNDILKEDGWIGPYTLLQVNTTSDRGIIQKYFELRMRHYANIVRRRRSQAAFLYAWTRRALDHV